MAFIKSDLLAARETAQDRQALARFFENFQMTFGSDAIGDQAGDMEVGIIVFKARSDGIDGSGHARCVRDEQNRSLEPFGDFCGGSDVRRRAGSIEKPHDAFDQGDIGAFRRAGEGSEDSFAPHHPTVEIVTRTLQILLMVARIQIVRTGLETDHSQASITQSAGHCEHRRGLAGSARTGGDHQTGNRKRRS